MIKIVVNKVPDVDLYTGGAYLVNHQVTTKEGEDKIVNRELLCLACRGMNFTKAADAESYLTNYVRCLQTPIGDGIPPGKVIGSILFTHKKVKYQLEYFINNNFTISTVEPWDDDIDAPVDVFDGRLYSYYWDIPKDLSKKVRTKLDTIAASTRVALLEK